MVFKDTYYRSLKHLTNNFEIIIILSNEGMDEKNYDRMVWCNNGIDLLSKEYIQVQSFFFRLFAHICSIEIKSLHSDNYLEGKVIKWLDNFQEINTIKFINRSGMNQLKEGTEGSSGYDLACLRDIMFEPYQMLKIATGVKVEFPKNLCGQIIGRSRNMLKILITLPNLIDSDYREELFVVL